MDVDDHTFRTRVWWDGGEVSFVRWTDRGLVFSWCGARETAIHMPRGAVVRLLEKGVLRIEGEVPEWMYEAQNGLGNLAPLTILPSAPTGTPAGGGGKPPASRDAPRIQPDGRQSIIKRLINKLAGV